MKKIMKMLGVFAAVTAIFAFSSCSSDDGSNDDNLKLALLSQTANEGQEVTSWTNTVSLTRYKRTYYENGAYIGFPDGKAETKQTLVFLSNNVVKARYEADVDGDGKTETFETTKNTLDNGWTMKYSGDTTKDGIIAFSAEGWLGTSDLGRATISGNKLAFDIDYNSWPGFEDFTKGDYAIMFDCTENEGIFTKVTK